MRRESVLVVAVVLAVILATPLSAEVKKAVGSIELTGPAGVVAAPGFDVTKLSIASDGKQLKIAATLKDPPGVVAGDVIELHFDTDNNPVTGVGLFRYRELTGFEYEGKLNACVELTGGTTVCAGRTTGKIKLHFGAINLERYKGAGTSDTETVVGTGGKASSKLPIEASLVQATLDYADLGVKSGQTIRILVRETCAKNDLSSFFPEIQLTLK